jgi:hypothetical protein
LAGGSAPCRLEAAWADSSKTCARCSACAPGLRRRRAHAFAAAGYAPGHDADRFDAFCAHLLVRAIAPGEHGGEVVATYRVLTPDAARRAGGFCGETEFDLAPLAPWRPRMAELGRFCIHPAWRTGGTILVLWSALGEFMALHGLDVALGCASVAMNDGGHAAASLWRQLAGSISPRPSAGSGRCIALETLRDDLEVETPP